MCFKSLTSDTFDLLKRKSELSVELQGLFGEGEDEGWGLTAGHVFFCPTSSELWPPFLSWRWDWGAC